MIAQPGLVVPFRADLFIELQAIARGRPADHVVVELDSNDELVITDRHAMDLATWQNAARLIRALSPKAILADQTVKPLTAYSQPMLIPSKKDDAGNFSYKFKI